MDQLIKTMTQRYLKSQLDLADFVAVISQHRSNPHSIQQRDDCMAIWQYIVDYQDGRTSEGNLRNRLLAHISRSEEAARKVSGGG